MDMDKISIIVPCYNIETYIGTTVKSICAQTYNNLEIILVDDGSKDRTLDVLRQLQKEDSRIRVIHKENGGVTSARICGIEQAAGEWIGFVDGDDYIEPEMFGHLLNNALQYHADISHCGYQMVFPGRVDLYYGTGHLIQQDKRTGLRDLLEGSMIEPGLGNKLFRRRLFNGLLRKTQIDTSIKINEDLLMNFYLFRESDKSVFEDICFYHYMVRKGSAATSKVNPNKLLDPLKVTRILINETAEISELHNICLKRLTRQLIGLATMRYGADRSLIYPCSKMARRELRRMLPQILSGCFCTRKDKLFALWAAIWPASYKEIHTVYARITGIDKKYEVS